MVKGLRIKTFLHFIPSIAMSIGSNEEAPSMSIQITDQKEEKYFLYNIIKSVESYFNKLICFELFLTKKEFQMGTILKKTQILECKKVIAPKGWQCRDSGALSRMRTTHQEYNVSFSEYSCA